MTATAPHKSETLVFRIAVAVIALHVADDNFLQPNPGTSAGDHLLSGLVPLAFLAAAAAGYARLRPILRGTTAIFVGVFGLAVGVEGWRAALGPGAAGDDFTGVLAIPAGVELPWPVIARMRQPAMIILDLAGVPDRAATVMLAPGSASHWCSAPASRLSMR